MPSPSIRPATYPSTSPYNCAFSKSLNFTTLSTSTTPSPPIGASRTTTSESTTRISTLPAATGEIPFPKPVISTVDGDSMSARILPSGASKATLCALRTSTCKAGVSSPNRPTTSVPKEEIATAAGASI